ncbi:MAG TPA: carbohydrate ABC transporter permease [Fimbriimonadaceae bacterium]|nr:hypothetical protein [Armatimonadota bacterium]HCM73355.1 hypothetical protein [Armatimonadota bacterium]HRD31910.1 carbohydrate ABC transporter permease [Fimbriimonadaceae bacterium]HRE94970.1 carbohydrate ABC transporter permease [Fimbriimonadaceae bacterium]HRI73891.1 carbohydrate ABC transporter permease [Fimbriimonadaceae bacterium]
MSLVGQVGRKRPRARLAMAVIYSLLIIGAITTLYPFAVMVTTATKGPTDQNDNKLWPAYWTDNAALTEKYIDDKYAGDMSRIAATRIGADASPEEVAKYRKFLAELPPTHWQSGFTTPANQVYSRLSAAYQAEMKAKFPRLDSLNQAYLELNTTFSSVAPPAENQQRKGWLPTPGPKYQDYVAFKEKLPTEFRIPVRAQVMYQEWLRTVYKNQIGDVPVAAKGEATTFEAIAWPPPPEWRTRFEAEGLPVAYKGDTVEDRWAKVSDGPMPIAAEEALWVQENAGVIRQDFLTRNFRYVGGYMLLNGRALINTAIFCLLAILTQLTVNPLAAYVLSRYPMKSTARVLLFLLATMAFPAEVAMIPSFLLLKDLGLLNTFAALVLPAAANGYMIFLLKGFFDSLPNEIFESGQLDGAKESTLMMRLAMPLSKPVLGYLALLAFMGAYGAFMYAFLVAQDQRMWTLMVFIYQLQQSAPKAVMMAAVTLAAVPTLVVFLSAQRVIMRGIVLPGER